MSDNENNYQIMKDAMEYLAIHTPTEKTVAQMKQDILLGINDEKIDTKQKLKKFITDQMEVDYKKLVKELGTETGIILTIPQAKKILSLLN